MIHMLKAAKSAFNFFENSEIVTNNIRFHGQYFDEETAHHTTVIVIIRRM
ncbi:hypothetical protein OW686_07625 [Acinetobacter baumannii]|nr:hypothetical protein [Acinetobacter baumannii]MDK2228583.1 hypothetical protein [Acinetobacter baumannii]